MPSNTTPEGRVKAQVDRILKRHNVWYFKPVSNGMGKHGIPDYICCIPPRGRMLAVECKGDSSLHPTALQQVQLDEISNHGGITFVATPDTVAALDVMLAAMASEIVK